MLQAKVIGYIGADAVTKNENGKEFTTFRVAHTDRYKDTAGQEHSTTQWVDVIMSGRPNVTDYLKCGTQVYVEGHAKLRCYSSEAARGFVAGIQITPVTLELLGGSNDVVPSRLYSADGKMHEVHKYYNCDAREEILNNGRGKQFAADENGWLLPLEEAQQMMAEQEKQTKKKNGK